ncbi:uncharacterized protein MELLADRAFT_87397 [Melampsora larici-populina 98AG31]|uniref:Uncharacterized protein n=1 Tax=Melampsora larici-populina (strain 98AG31 / pathotype 3-4-7) TaxID=747676 RepID=F4RN59_MELLP|nr:uncharacterized protein MELLADRAFT_87397 [Melampsora larici-populina 98AG31]EGG06275.1 hypothetical protein MELLADRAFT_87397 [Melampsora larici-populina 98AG31]
MSDPSSISTLPSTLTSDKSLTSTQTAPLDSSTATQTSGASLDSKKQTSSSFPTIGVSSLPPELASASIIPVGLASEQQPISQDSVAKPTSSSGGAFDLKSSNPVSQDSVGMTTLSDSLDKKSSNLISQDPVGKNSLSDSLDTKLSSSIPITSSTPNSLQSTIPKSFIEAPPTDLNQSSISTSTSTLSPSSTLLPTQSLVKPNETSTVLVPASNKTPESVIVPAKTTNQESSTIPKAVNQQSNTTAIHTNVNTTATSSSKNSAKNDGNSSLHSGGTALIILTILFIGIIAGLLFWRRRRRDANERKNIVEGIEKVTMNKKGGDLEKGEYLSSTSSDGSMMESHEDGHEFKEGGYFGKKGIIRSSRPRSLLLKEGTQAGDKNTIAINQTPSLRSQQISPESNHEGLQVPGVHLRSNRLQNRPNSWRSSIAVAWASLGIPARLLNEPSHKLSPGINSLDRSNSSSTNASHKKPIETQTYRPPAPAPDYRSTRFKGPAADHQSKTYRLSQMIREEEESCVSSSVEDGSSSLQSESPTNGSSITGSYTESCIGSSKLSRSSSSDSQGSPNQSITESLNSSSTLQGSHSLANSLSHRSDSVSGNSSDESHTISSKANSFFTEEIGLNQIRSDSKIGSQVSIDTHLDLHQQIGYHEIDVNQKPIELIVHGNAM